MKCLQYGGALCEKAREKSAWEKRALEFKLRLCYAAFTLLAFALVLSVALSRLTGRDAPAFAVRAGDACVSFATPVLDGEAAFTRRELLLGTLVLASPEHPLPTDYPGGNARGFKALFSEYIPASETFALRLNAAYALCDMRLERPLEDIFLSVGAVSYEEQTALRRAAFEGYLAVSDPARALSQTDLYAPEAGKSEHQTGLCFDIALRGTQSFASADPLLRTDAGAWLSENLWRFGFIRRYASDGYEEGGCDGIHIRYVGKPHAAAMRLLGLTLEEYLALLSGGQALFIESGAEKHLVYALEDDGRARYPAPKDAAVQGSLDNRGYVVLTARVE